MRAHSFPLAGLPALLCLLGACADDSAGGRPRARAEQEAEKTALTWESLAERPERESGKALFQRLEPASSGITLTNDFDWEHPQRHLYGHGFGGGGVAIGDYDADGLPDLYLSSQTGADALYRQVAPLQFQDVSRAAGLSPEVRWGAGAAFGDLDGDGDLDLFICNYDGPNQLYLNQGDGSFRELAEERGLAFSGASVMAAFADYDGDGDLDIYLVTNRLYPGPGKDEPRTEQVDGEVRIARGSEEAFEIVTAERGGQLEKYVGKAGQPDRLYRNDGRGHFELVTKQAGLWHLGPGLAATWWDYDKDGRPDLYVGNDFFSPDRLYHNLGDGRFRERLGEAMPHSPWFSMGNAAADLDGDGLLDLVATDMAASSHYRSKLMMGDMADSRWFLESAEPRQYMRNAVYRNTGTGRFMELAQLAGLASTDWTWSVKLGDLDADGRVDAFFTNGSANNSFEPDLQRRISRLSQNMKRARRPQAEILETQWELYRSQPPRREQNLAFRNLGDWRFDAMGADWGLDEEVISYGAAMADLDRDGDLDLVLNHLGETAAVYRNDSSEGNVVLLRLRGRESGSFGLGARVELELENGESQVRYLSSASGFMSADEPLVHFGLGSASMLRELRVLWPSGRVQRFHDLAPGRLYTITEAGEAPVAQAAEAPPIYRDQAASFGLSLGAEPELPFDDYARQPLLPYKLSQYGPVLAVGDATGDGLDDLFVGGSRGRAGRVLRARAEGGFATLEGPWSEDAAAEDAAPLWFDADGDGDLDLFVGSGGVECEPGDNVLLDRLYLNQGELRFVRAPATWLAAPPARDAQRASTGCAVAADLDGDGRQDLFLGARSVPGSYPVAPESRLLIGTGAGFVDKTDELAPGLRTLGMVTSALASDVDLDGRLDLLVALEWGSLCIWRNTGAGFEDESASLGVATKRGWWNSIVAGDLDADGDQDYVLLGAGLNTKYRADAKSSPQLFFGDFEGDGRANLIEAKAGSELLPVRGLSCSSGPIPSLRERMPSFELFASATLPEIYGETSVEQALSFSINELSSGIWFNELNSAGERSLRWQPLPRLAQGSPGYGALLQDLDGDGHTDLYFLQNFYQREPETGRWDGGLSLLLEGQGQGELSIVPTRRSGLLVPGDGTALVSLDADRDGSLDLLAAENDGPLRLFMRQPAPQRATLTLRGLGQNPAAIGARVTFKAGPGAGRCIEWRAGGGHHSQASNLAAFGFPLEPGSGEPRPMPVGVRWPDGRESNHLLEPQSASHVIAHPDL